ncbi:MAG: sigma factor-like helix-turn-helix DNA-binding protein [Acidimicrobiales bacterium]
MCRSQPAEQATTAEPAIELWELVASLAARQRQAVVLRYVADLDEETMAEVMRVSRSTVSSSLTTARRRLSHVLTEDEPAVEVERE